MQPADFHKLRRAARRRQIGITIGWQDRHADALISRENFTTFGKGWLSPASTSTLIKTTLNFMAWTKLKTAVVVGAIALLGIGGAAVAIHHRDIFPQTSALAFAGYATPEAAIQSMLWSGSRGDFKGYQAGCTPAQAQRMQRKMAGKSEEEIRREAVAWASALAGYRITRREPVSDDEVHLHISAPASASGLQSGNVVVVMRRIGNQWRQDGDR